MLMAFSIIQYLQVSNQLFFKDTRIPNIFTLFELIAKIVLDIFLKKNEPFMGRKPITLEIIVKVQ